MFVIVLVAELERGILFLKLTLSGTANHAIIYLKCGSTSAKVDNWLKLGKSMSRQDQAERPEPGDGRGAMGASQTDVLDEVAATLTIIAHVVGDGVRCGTSETKRGTLPWLP